MPIPRILAACLVACLAVGCEQTAATGSAAESAATAAQRIDPGPHELLVLEIADLGDIHVELLPEIAPKTVDHFKKLAAEGLYDNTTFHRVIPGFMIQGGDPNTKDKDPRDDGQGGPGYTISDEISGLSHSRGVVSMANRGQRHTAGSQFFIVHQDSPHLDAKYTAFGRVVSGMEVVDAITELEIDEFGRWGPRDRPHPVAARLARARIVSPAVDTVVARAEPPAAP